MKIFCRYLIVILMFFTTNQAFAASELGVGKILGYTVSSMASAPGFLADGAIYAVGGTSVFLVSCSPALLTGILLSAATNSSAGHALGCLELEEFNLEKLEKNHPHLGTRIWNSLKELR